MMWIELMLEFLDTYAYQWKPITYRWYQKRLEPFADFLTDRQVTTPEAITLLDVRRFLNQQQQTAAASTMNGVHTALGLFFRWLRAEGRIPTDIFAEARLKRPRKPRRRPRDLPLRYVERMIAAAGRESTSLAVRDAAIMRLLISTGMRRIELVRLRVCDIDLIEHLAIIRGKRDDERNCFPDAATIQAIKVWLVVRPETDAPELFVSLAAATNAPVGSPLKPDTLNARLAHWRNRAGIPQSISVSPHKWRHTFATQYIINGGDAFSLGQLLGHSDVQTTQIYVAGVKSVLKEKAKLHGPKIMT